MRYWLFGICCLGWVVASTASASSTLPVPSLNVVASDETPIIPAPDTEPLQVCLLEPTALEEPREDCPVGNVVTKDTISQTELTLPSLWWAHEQFGNKLLENWLAYPDKRRVDLVVSRQRWGLMDYLQRYEFVNHMGTVVRPDGYNLRVFNRQDPTLPIAAYTCNFNVSPPACRIEIGIVRPSLQDSIINP
jgi:hypothetical protein